MDFIIGGAYQGKLDYAKQTFNLTPEDICVCTDSAVPDFSSRCLTHYEQYVLYCIRNNSEDYKNLPEGDFVIIADDIFCGVVPIDDEIRLWREECGRTFTAIAEKSETVTRLFCGLPKRIK